MKHSIVLIMVCLALALAACGPAVAEPTTTPEVFIPLDKAIPDAGIVLEGVHLRIAGSTLSREFPAGCTGAAPGCVQAKDGAQFLAVTFAPRDLPEGNMLAYKNLPAVNAAMEGGTRVPYSLTRYDNANANLTIGFEVPAEAKVFGLRWADLGEIPLNVEAQ